MTMRLHSINYSIQNELLNKFLATNKEFYEAVRFADFKNYDLVDYDGRLVSRMLLESKLDVEIVFKKTLNPWASVNGWCYPPQPIIYLNARRDFVNIANFTYTVVHELIHLIGINHGTNTLKKDCVHEVVANIARRLI